VGVGLLTGIHRRLLPCCLAPYHDVGPLFPPTLPPSASTGFKTA
jgi:hypothetical protein